MATVLKRVWSSCSLAVTISIILHLTGWIYERRIWQKGLWTEAICVTSQYKRVFWLDDIIIKNGGNLPEIILLIKTY